MDLSEDHLLFHAVQQDDDTDAFRKLFSRFWDKVYAIAYHRLGDEQDADDLVQELFISIWERRSEIILRSSFEQYIIGAVKFKVISVIRNRGIKEQVFKELKMRMTEIEYAKSDYAVYPDLEETLNSSLLSLNDNVRMAFMLRADNLSIKEIAIQLGLQEQTVRNYIATAIYRVRSVIKDKYGDEPILYSCIMTACLYNYLT